MWFYTRHFFFIWVNVKDTYLYACKPVVALKFGPQIGRQQPPIIFHHEIRGIHEMKNCKLYEFLAQHSSFTTLKRN